jgi:rhodanese-related sulfurtransferase
MKRLHLILLLMFLSKLGFSQISSSLYSKMLDALLNHTAKEITVEKAELLFNTAQFVDSREQNEFDVSHISGACWVGYTDFDIRRTEHLDKEKPVIVYCSVGKRSENIALKLEDAGFKEVYNLYGGVFEWKNQDHDLVDPSGVKTEKVHAYNRIWGFWLDKGEKVY